MKFLICLFITHFISDFFFQSRNMGKKKSKEILYLILHGNILFFAFILCSFIFIEYNIAAMISLSLVIIHCLQDWYIWRIYQYYVLVKLQNENLGCTNKELKEYINSEDYKYWEDYWFYVTLGLDQLLHFITIILICIYWGVI